MRTPRVRLAGLRVPEVPRTLWVILAVALAIRVAAVVTITPYLREDPSDYDGIAASIARGTGYRDTATHALSAFRAPAYPYFLAGVYKVAGHRVRAARLAQALLGTAVVALIALLAWQFWDRRVALIAAGIAAAYPPLIIVGTALASESLALPLELGVLAAVVEYRRSRGRGWLVGAGLTAGLMALTRANGILLLVPLVIALWPSARLSLRALAPAATLLVLAVLAMTPWTIRNAVVMHAFIPVNTETGVAVAGQYNAISRTHRAIWRHPGTVPQFAPWFRDRRYDEVELDSKLSAAAAREIRHHPLHVLEAIFWNTVRLVHLSDRRGAYFRAGGLGVSRRDAAIGVVGFWVLAVFALGGLATGAARRAPLFFWLFPLLIWASEVWIHNPARVRTPLDPFLIILAALGIAAAASRARRPRPGQHSII